MVNYTCEKCKKEFIKKSHYLVHINKKFPCVQFKEQIQINPDEFKKIQKLEIFNENKENNKNFSCNFCNKIFFNNSNLNKHLKNNSCKVKKLQDEEKENIFKILLAKDEEMKALKENNKELKEYIKNITNMNLDLNNKVNKLIEKISVGNINKGVINNNNNNINNINNIIITTDQLCNFGSVLS